jgi:protein-tyrosine phosphatase
MTIDTDFSRKAPKGKFRIVGVDTFSNDDWHEKDVATLQKAKKFIEEKTKGQQMLKYYIYDENGRFVADAGTF